MASNENSRGVNLMDVSWGFLLGVVVCFVAFIVVALAAPPRPYPAIDSPPTSNGIALPEAAPEPTTDLPPK